MAATVSLKPTTTGKLVTFDTTPYAGMTILRARLVPSVAKRTGDGLHAKQDVKLGGVVLPWAEPRYTTLEVPVTVSGKPVFDCRELTSWNGLPTLELMVAELMGNSQLPSVPWMFAQCQSGQVFLRWQDAADPAVPVLPDVCSPDQYKAALAAIKANPRKVRYRIYKSRTKDIRDAKLVDEIGLLWQWSPDRWGWNGVDADRRVPKPGENVPRLAMPFVTSPLLAANEAIYVDTPDTPNDSASDTWYYGISVAVNGEENLDAIEWSIDPVQFVPAVPSYHYQFTKREPNYGGIPDVNVAYYVRWESPKTLTSNMPSEPCWYTVGEPAGRAELAPAMMCFHPWGGMVGDAGQPPQQLPSRKPVILSTGQRCDVYDFYTGYCEAFRTHQSFVGSTWHSYTYNRCRQFIDWAIATHELDPEQIGVHGGSMGGTGSMMQAVFNEKINVCHTRVGDIEPDGPDGYAKPATPGHTSPGNRVRDLWGPPGALQQQTTCYIDGANVSADPYRACDLVRVVREGKRRLPYIVMGFGSNDTAIPPAQHFNMMDALAVGGYGHAASWDDKGHGALAWSPSTGTIKSNDSDLIPRRSESFPAFSKCSLDSPNTFAIGQRNRWLCWERVNGGFDIWLNPTAPAENCTTYVTLANSDIPPRPISVSKTLRTWVTFGPVAPPPTPDPIPQLAPDYVLGKLATARTAIGECEGRSPDSVVEALIHVFATIDAAKNECLAWKRGEFSV